MDLDEVCKRYQGTETFIGKWNKLAYSLMEVSALAVPLYHLWEGILALQSILLLTRRFLSTASFHLHHGQTVSINKPYKLAGLFSWKNLRARDENFKFSLVFINVKNPCDLTRLRTFMIFPGSRLCLNTHIYKRLSIIFYACLNYSS